ncbi:MAG: penicillin-binding protein 2 [Methylococcales bacterium]|nr:penicillin-binding protein 2 [Methylococcales bacterium]
MRDFFKKTTRQSKKTETFVIRRRILLSIILFGMVLLVLRGINLQVVKKEFLQAQGAKRYLKEIPVSTYRGKIFDRNGQLMAISSPVQSIWTTPQTLKYETQLVKIEKMIEILALPDAKIEQLQNKNVKFTYLKRHISPELAAKVRRLKIKGVGFKREFKRFYPAGVMSSHLLGFTNIKDEGQEGLERAFEEQLKGRAGTKRILRDGRRRVLENFEEGEVLIPGEDLILSIDRRLQHLAFRELQNTYIESRAKSASLVILDAKTGDILAAVTQPAFNPNNRKNLKGSAYRNRVLTDVFEPASTVKPLVVAAALEKGYIAENALIATNGVYKIGKHTVRDGGNLGRLSLTNVLKKSSNIAVSKISLMMPSEYLWSTYKSLGFSQSAKVGFPGEAHGSLIPLMKWDKFTRATLSFGYGVSTSTLQLAKAYTALADDGILHSVSLLKRQRDDNPQRIFSVDVARKVRAMMEHVIEPGGTGYRANVPGYRVAGKTGTAKKAIKGGYSSDNHFSLFAGMAPASQPRFVIAVMVDDPQGKYYGGLVAAPLFSRVMAGALRIYGVEPDKELASVE